MRNLASVQIIAETRPIEGADQIEMARVLGWECVVKKGEFFPGVPVVYIEIDSIVPSTPEFDFMKERKYRVKTIKLRGQISQGLIMPLSLLPRLKNSVYKEGQDVTDILGVTKWEPYQTPSKLPKRFQFLRQRHMLPFPSFIPKTDETRIQAMPELLDKYAGAPFYFTEKMDGQSFTAWAHNGKFGVASRNHEIRKVQEPAWYRFVKAHSIRARLRKLEWTLSWLPGSGWLEELTDTQPSQHGSFWDVVDGLELEARMLAYSKKTGESIALQGELCGPGIQGNKYKLSEKQVFCFQIWDIKRGVYWDRGQDEVLCASWGIQMVPLLGSLTLCHTVSQLVHMSKGKAVFNQKTPREGLVFRPVKETRDTSIRDLHLNRVSFKVINPDFLLKED